MTGRCMTLLHGRDVEREREREREKERERKRERERVRERAEDGEGDTYGGGRCNTGPVTMLENRGHKLTH